MYGSAVGQFHQWAFILLYIVSWRVLLSGLKPEGYCWHLIAGLPHYECKSGALLKQTPLIPCSIASYACPDARQPLVPVLLVFDTYLQTKSLAWQHLLQFQ